MKKILVVDDDAEIRRMIAGLLSAEFEVIEVPDGPEALRRLDEHHPALVIVDLDMPGMGGIEFLRASRESRNGTIFMMLTANHDLGAALEALKEGAVMYMTKPWEPESLRAEVKRLLALDEPKNASGAPWRIETG
jgi:two-component system response regulator FlrC